TRIAPASWATCRRTIGSPSTSPCPRRVRATASWWSRSSGTISADSGRPERSMRIDRIDCYWVKVPLAFVWRTSYADPTETDTILGRMEGEGHRAGGESCPPFIPAYSAEHTAATFETLRHHMAPRIVRQDIGGVEELLERLAFIKGNQFARAALEITW